MLIASSEKSGEITVTATPTLKPSGGSGGCNSASSFGLGALALLALVSCVIRKNKGKK